MILFILSGIPLPWTHFFGVNVLIADQFVWLMLWWTGQASLKRIFFINLSLAAVTLPVVPIAVFYKWTDRPFPLFEVNGHFGHFAYFFRTSSQFFMKVSTPGLESVFPFFLFVFVFVYVGVLFYLVQVVRDHSTKGYEQKTVASYVELITTGFLLAGFTATQVHFFLGKTPIFSRYMLAGSWVHLPLSVMLLLNFSHKKLSRVLCTLVFLSSGFALTDFLQRQSHDRIIAAYIKDHWQADDAFLVQSMDHWHGPNHFDQLWFQSYVDANLPTTTGIFKLRFELHRDGLPAPITVPSAQRVWIYSHLFTENWLRNQSISGWNLTEIHDFGVTSEFHNLGGTYPLALLERVSNSTPDVSSVLSQPVSVKNVD